MTFQGISSIAKATGFCSNYCEIVVWCLRIRIRLIMFDKIFEPGEKDRIWHIMPYVQGYNDHSLSPGPLSMNLQKHCVSRWPLRVDESLLCLTHGILYSSSGTWNNETLFSSDMHPSQIRIQPPYTFFHTEWLLHLTIPTGGGGGGGGGGVSAIQIYTEDLLSLVW